MNRHASQSFWRICRFAALALLALPSAALAQLAPGSPTAPTPGSSTSNPSVVSQGPSATAAGAWPFFLTQGGVVLSVSNPIFDQITNFPAIQAVSQSGAWTVVLGTGSNAVGTIGVTSLPSLSAGSAIVGKFGIDQTTPGTTNGVVVSSSALPTGAATSALQTANNVPTYEGTAASTATLAGCAFASAAGPLSTMAPGQGASIQCDSVASIKLAERGSPDAVVGITPTTTAAAGATSLVAKASPGNLYGYTATNLTATAGFVAVINATAAPSSGTAIAPLECRLLPASGLTDKSYNPGPPPSFSTGIVILVSTSCATYTPAGATFIESLVR